MKITEHVFLQEPIKILQHFKTRRKNASEYVAPVYGFLNKCIFSEDHIAAMDGNYTIPGNDAAAGR